MFIVEAPAIEEAKYGLFSLPGDLVEYSDDDRFSAETHFESLACKASTTNRDVCDNTKFSIVSAASAQNTGDQTQWGFSVQVIDTCSTFGYEARDGEKRALDFLDAVTQKAVENELWTGAVAVAATHTTNDYLASTAATDLTPAGSGVKLRQAVALLEKAIGDMGAGGRGIIHMPRNVASAATLRHVDDHLETNLGNYVVAGSGYTGSSPAGVAATPTATWVYATGLVRVILGRPFVLGDLSDRTDRSINTITTYAERAAWATFDGCAHFAVKVDTTLDYA